MSKLEKRRPSAPRFVWWITALALAVIYVPLLVLVTYSFLDEQVVGNSFGWTLAWYRKALGNEQVLAALGVSLRVGIVSTLISTVLGTAGALALSRPKFRGRRAFNVLTHVPLIMPEIVTGLSLLIWFVFLNLTLGLVSIILAHVTFSLSYVVITVRARLFGFDLSLEEAARDLGATPWQTFRHVKLPLIWPGVVAGALLAFTLSFDDFLVTFFTAGVGYDTLPLKIYGMIKFGVSPEINALSTLLLVTTGILVWIVSRKSNDLLTE